MMNETVLQAEFIATRIFYIRGEKVLLDLYPASFYEVETRALKQQVRRNIERFPDDFMFQLTKDEWQELITICDDLGSFKFSTSFPFANTEQSVAILSGNICTRNSVMVTMPVSDLGRWYSYATTIDQRTSTQISLPTNDIRVEVSVIMEGNSWVKTFTIDLCSKIEIQPRHND